MRWSGRAAPVLGSVLLALTGCDVLFGIDYIEAPNPDAGSEMGTWSEVAAGEAHSCAVRLDGSLWCWGRNDGAQLALDPMTREVDTPTQVPGTWKHVATQYDTTCAIHSDDTAWCWGANSAGETGLPQSAPVATPNQVSTDHFVQIAAGFFFNCGLRDDGKVLCWGYNVSGESGWGDTTPLSNVPRPIDSPLTFTAITAGASHACAIATDRSLWCWGYNAYGQVGVGDATNHISPTQVPGQWLSVGAAYYHTCGVLADGHLRCWGYSPHGQLGNTASNLSTVPQLVGADNDGWTSVTTGAEQSCAQRDDGSLWCWGANDALQLASTTAPALDPVPTPITGGPARWLSLGLGRSHFCGVGDDHALWCAGMISGGRIGDGSGSWPAPTHVMTGGMLVASASTATCTIDSANARWCWGANAMGQLGDGTTQLRDQPTQASGTGAPIVLGDHDGCVIDASDHLQCWGSSPYYEIDPTMARHLSPIDVAASSAPWVAVALGNHTCAIAQGGMLSCWGYSVHGEVGNGTTNASVMSPTPIALPMQSWTSVATGDYHTCGVTTLGVYCWGYNAAYALGDGTTTDHATPSPIGSPVTSGTIYAAGDNSCLLSNTRLYCWGTNQAGELGTGVLGATPTPTAVMGAWREVALGRDHTCAIALDDSLWCWGSNAFGELGDGTMTDALVPTPIGTDRWTHVSVGDTHTCAIRSDGDVACWGANEMGQLGLPHLRQPFFRLP